MTGALLAVPAVPAVPPAGADVVCVRVGDACHATLAAALTAAQDGDTVDVPAGSFPGGVTITSSITLAGAGASRTSIVGGGPVLTVGTHLGENPPTVVVKGITLTGGVATTSPYSVDFTGLESAVASGGGLEIPPSAGFGRGATVTVVDSVITGNRVEPADQLHRDWGDGGPVCPDGPCPFAGAFGGGIDSWGDLTLRRTTVSGNQASGELSSDSVGGGIANWGDLRLERSTVSGNGALADRWGRYAEGGGIFSQEDTTLELWDSSVSGNEARLTSSFPSYLDDGTYLDMLVNSGGIHVSGFSPVTIVRSRIDGNTAAIDAPHAVWGVINAGLQAGNGELVMRDSSVSRNRLQARLLTTPDAPGSAVEWDGVADISGSRFVGNTSVVTAEDGVAGVSGAVASLAILVQETDPGRSVVRDSVISDNVAKAVSPHGSAVVVGAGVFNDSSLVLEDVEVTRNRAVAVSTEGVLQGGGIWNGAAEGYVPDPPSSLVLRGSSVTNNALQGAAAVLRQGGGLFTEVPVTLQDTELSGNRPDQCVGCDDLVLAAHDRAQARAAAHRGLHQQTSPLRDRLASRALR